MIKSPSIKNTISRIRSRMGSLGSLCPTEKQPQSNLWPRAMFMDIAIIKASNMPLTIIVVERGYSPNISESPHTNSNAGTIIAIKLIRFDGKSL